MCGPGSTSRRNSDSKSTRRAISANTAWWTQFRDPVLVELVRIALVENKDLRIATARIEEFAGRFRSTRADSFPQIGYSVSAAGQRSTEVGPVPLTPGIDNPESLYDTLFTVTWELDVWGRIRRLSEAARAELLASEEGRRTVILTLVSSVAGGYVNLRDLDKQLAISHGTVKTREEALQLFEKRFQGGVISEVELAQVRSEYEAALATIPQIETSIAQNENALSVLLGRDPGRSGAPDLSMSWPYPRCRRDCPQSYSRADRICARRSRTSSPPTPASGRRGPCTIRGSRSRGSSVFRAWSFPISSWVPPTPGSSRAA